MREFCRIHIRPFWNSKSVGFKNENKTRKHQAVKLSKPIWLSRALKQRKGFFLLRQFRKKPSQFTCVFSIYLYSPVLAKVALTDFAAVIDTVQVPVPEHPPDQPEKTDPLFAKAAKVTDVLEL